MDLRRFARQGWEDFDRTANFLPSSRFLVRAMLDYGALPGARRVVELGPGTGAITRVLLARLPAGAELVSVECDHVMHEALARSVVDPAHTALLGDAADLGELLESAGKSGPVDAIFSSLAMSLLDPGARDAIYDACARALAPEGVLVQYAYVHARHVVYSPTRGFSRFDTRRYLDSRFHDVERTLVALNIPPAWVYRCRGPAL